MFDSDLGFLWFIFFFILVGGSRSCSLHLSFSSSSSKPYLFSRRSRLTALSLRIPSNLSHVFSLRFHLGTGGDSMRRLLSVLCSVAKEKTLPQEKKTEETQKSNLKRKLFVFSLPWSMSVNDISEIFRGCVLCEILMPKDGKNRGFAFVTMASGEEAQADG